MFTSFCEKFIGLKSCFLYNYIMTIIIRLSDNRCTYRPFPVKSRARFYSQRAQFCFSSQIATILLPNKRRKVKNEEGVWRIGVGFHRLCFMPTSWSTTDFDLSLFESSRASIISLDNENNNKRVRWWNSAGTKHFLWFVSWTCTVLEAFSFEGGFFGSNDYQN